MLTQDLFGLGIGAVQQSFYLLINLPGRLFAAIAMKIPLDSFVVAELSGGKGSQIYTTSLTMPKLSARSGVISAVE